MSPFSYTTNLIRYITQSESYDLLDMDTVWAL